MLLENPHRVLRMMSSSSGGVLEGLQRVKKISAENHLLPQNLKIYHLSDSEGFLCACKI